MSGLKIYERVTEREKRNYFPLLYVVLRPVCPNIRERNPVLFGHGWNSNGCGVFHTLLVVSTPLKILVSWDDYFQSMEKIKAMCKNVPNHQSDTCWHYIPAIHRFFLSYAMESWAPLSVGPVSGGTATSGASDARAARGWRSSTDFACWDGPKLRDTWNILKLGSLWWTNWWTNSLLLKMAIYIVIFQFAMLVYQRVSEQKFHEISSVMCEKP